MRGAALGLAVALLAVPGSALAAPLPTDRYETLIIGSDQSAWERGPAGAPVLIELYFAPGHAGAAAAAEVVRRGIPRSDGRRDGVAVREAVRLVPLRAPDGPDVVSEALVEAAGQGRFWELFDRLTQERVPPTQVADLQRLFGEAGLDTAKLAEALASHRHQPRVRELWRSALDEGHAPAEMLANGRRLSTWMNADTFDTAVTAAARRTERIVEDGVAVQEAIEQLRTREREQMLAVERNRLPRRVAYALPGDARRGPGFAPVTLQLFGTLGNPAAAEWAQAIRRLEGVYPGSIQLVFHNLVVLRGSSDERLLALALIAARSGKFWPLYDAVFSGPARGQRRSVTEIETIARRLGVEVDVFELIEKRDAEKLGDQRRLELSRLGLGASPLVLCNGLVLPSGLPFERLRRYIESELGRGVLERSKDAATRPAVLRLE